MKTSQDPPLPLRIYPPFLTAMCDLPRIYPSLPGYTSFQQLYATLLESTSPSQNITSFQPLRVYPFFQQLYAALPESIPPS